MGHLVNLSLHPGSVARRLEMSSNDPEAGDNMDQNEEGDENPTSLCMPTQILNICCMVWGTLLMSCILVILTNTLTLNPKEEEALCVLKRVEINIEYRNLCRLYVRETLWRLWSKYKRRGNKREPVS